jgi:integrase
MSNTKHTGEIQATYFAWRLRVRDEVWYADGRKAGLGKHSLGTKNYNEAVEQLRQLDQRMAADRGMIPLRAELQASEITIPDGWTRFLDHRGRPQVMGGVTPATLKRYRPIRDKHIAFCDRRGIKFWSQVDKARTEEFGIWLSAKSADRTLKLELELIISVIRYLVTEKLLPAGQCFVLQLSKPLGSDTYCYRREEVAEMIAHCRRTAGLEWFADVIVGLAATGLRSEEFNQLKWSEVDLDAGVLRLRDQRHSTRKRVLANTRTIKGKRDRILPINPAFREVLERQPRHPDGLVFMVRAAVGFTPGITWRSCSRRSSSR